MLGDMTFPTQKVANQFVLYGLSSGQFHQLGQDHVPNHVGGPIDVSKQFFEEEKCVLI